MTAPGVSENERQKLLDQWERVTFRIFGLFGKDSRTKVGDYVRLAFQIVTEEIERRTYNQMMAGLRELGSEYPIDQALQEGVIGKDCYEQADVCRYLLWLYEEQLAKQLGTAATVDEKERIGIWKLQAAESIEHIFPRNPASQAAWQDKMRNADGMDQPLHPNVGRIGNLLLLALALNQQAQNLPFTKKKEIYAKHNLRMVREVSQQNDWTLSQIEQRELKISGWAKTRWSDI
jgi:hypothetical protein